MWRCSSLCVARLAQESHTTMKLACSHQCVHSLLPDVGVVQCRCQYATPLQCPLLPPASPYACRSAQVTALEAQLKEAGARLAADKMALQLELQRVQVAEEKAAAALAAAKEQAARADSERAWVRQQQEELTPRLESTSALQVEAKQRARELASQAEELANERHRLEGERATLERLRAQLEASQAQADRALAQAAEVSAREAALAAKERGVIEAEAALKLREAQVAQVRGQRMAALGRRKGLHMHMLCPCFHPSVVPCVVVLPA